VWITTAVRGGTRVAFTPKVSDCYCSCYDIMIISTLSILSLGRRITRKKSEVEACSGSPVCVWLSADHRQHRPRPATRLPHHTVTTHGAGVIEPGSFRARARLKRETCFIVKKIHVSNSAKKSSARSASNTKPRATRHYDYTVLTRRSRVESFSQDFVSLSGQTKHQLKLPPTPGSLLCSNATAK